MVKFFTLSFLVFLSLQSKSQTIAFTYTNANGGGFCSPATINFTPVYTGNLVGLTWYFGNGQTSNSAIPSINYTAGTYTVKLVAVFQNEAIETSQTITVAPSFSINLSANISKTCKVGNVIFTASSTAPNSTYTFNFADGSPPVTGTSNTVTHYYADFGIYNATVKVVTPNGCADSVSYQVEITKIQVSGSANPVQGCAPVLVAFNTSVTLPAGSSVSNYQWSFGDNTAPVTSTIGAQTHPYTDSGTYHPTVITTTIEGCKDTLKLNELNFGIPPTNLVAFPRQTVYCGRESAKFYGYAPIADAYKWEYGDGTFDITPDTTASHKYSSLGIKLIKVTPFFKDCPGTPITFSISIVGVIANYSFKNTCAAKNTFQFTNLSVGVPTSTIWSFGDGSPDAFVTAPVHTYPAPGAFNTQLFLYDNVSGCTDTIGFFIFTGAPQLINPDTVVCRNASSTFSVINSYPNPSCNYTWTLFGQADTSAGPILTVPAPNHGVFPSTVTIQISNSYCPDTLMLNHPISVRGPIASFLADTTGCTNNNFIINNTSVPFAASDTIKNWSWTFGIPGLTSTQYQPAPYIYGAEGSYSINLIAQDKRGCFDSIKQSVLVKESPFLRIFPRGDKICSGKMVTLTAYHTDTLVWLPASAVTCATCDTTFTTPTATTTIFALASNSVGCTLRDSTTITVYSPFTATPSVNIASACIGDTVHLAVTPTDKKVLWSPAFGLSNPAIFNPVATVFTDTTYTALLTDSAGCYSSSAVIKIKPFPSAFVNAGPNRIVAANSPFTISPTYSASVNNYLWSPAANLNCTTCPSPSGVADSARTFIIKVSTANGCMAKDTVSILIECAYANLFMAGAFAPSTNNIGIVKYYYPQTRGIKTINRFSVYNRFGEVIYEVKNAQPNVRSLGWDGKYKGIPQGIDGYVYILEATCELGEIITKKGSFVLVK